MTLFRVSATPSRYIIITLNLLCTVQGRNTVEVNRELYYRQNKTLFCQLYLCFVAMRYLCTPLIPASQLILFYKLCPDLKKWCGSALGAHMFEIKEKAEFPNLWPLNYLIFTFRISGKARIRNEEFKSGKNYMIWGACNVNRRKKERITSGQWPMSLYVYYCKF